MTKKEQILHYAIEFIMVFSGVLLAFYFSQLGADKGQRAEDRRLLQLLANECSELPESLGGRIDRLDSVERRLRAMWRPGRDLGVDSVSAIIEDVVIPSRVRVRNEEPIILIKPQVDQRFLHDLELREALEMYYTYSLASEEVSDEEQSFIKDRLRPYFERYYEYKDDRILDPNYHRTPEFRNYVLHLVRYTAMRKAIFDELLTRSAELDSIVEERLRSF